MCVTVCVVVCIIGEHRQKHNEVPRERMRSPQSTINYSVNIPTWSSFIQRRRLSARRAVITHPARTDHGVRKN